MEPLGRALRETNHIRRRVNDRSCSYQSFWDGDMSNYVEIEFTDTYEDLARKINMIEPVAKLERDLALIHI